MKIKIEKNVPLPSTDRYNRGRRSGENAYPFRDMKVGDSFVIPVKEKWIKKPKIQQSSVHTVARLWAMYWGLKWKFSTRSEIKNKKQYIRVWRIA